MEIEKRTVHMPDTQMDEISAMYKIRGDIPQTRQRVARSTIPILNRKPRPLKNFASMGVISAAREGRSSGGS